jgi:hypothetical protein
LTDDGGTGTAARVQAEARGRTASLTGTRGRPETSKARWGGAAPVDDLDDDATRPGRAGRT